MRHHPPAQFSLLAPPSVCCTHLVAAWPGTGGCTSTGEPPAECDARCGVVYLDYFARCSQAVRVFFPEQYDAFRRLDETCRNMPVGPLLELLAPSGRCAEGGVDHDDRPEDPQHMQSWSQIIDLDPQRSHGICMPNADQVSAKLAMLLREGLFLSPPASPVALCRQAIKLTLLCVCLGSRSRCG